MAIGALVYVAFVLSFLAYSEGYINPPDYGGALLLLAGAWNLLLLIVTVLVIIDAVRKVRAGMTRELVRGCISRNSPRFLSSSSTSSSWLFSRW